MSIKNVLNLTKSFWSVKRSHIGDCLVTNLSLSGQREHNKLSDRSSRFTVPMKYERLRSTREFWKEPLKKEMHG